MRAVFMPIAAAVISALCTTQAMAQTTVISPGQTISVTATIEDIDLAKRLVVLRNDDGAKVGVFAPPEVTRLNELRIGDVVTITYYDSVVYRLRRPGSPRPPVSEEVGAVESTSALPGVTFSHQLTERVTVKSVDPAASSITVTGREGRTVSRRVSDASNLAGVKAGDHIDITYTEALLATVTRAK